MSKRKTIAECNAEIAALTAENKRLNARPNVEIKDTQVGIFSDLHAEAVIELARAAQANAEAIKSVAQRASVNIETGIRIGS